MKFDEVYEELNDRQRQAVDAIEGPVLVIAGPGTGKTQLLSMRVANILRKTDSSPQNVLCLTFTNKAATNMQERANQLTGGEASNVNIKTFHSFAAEIMNTHSQYFWNGANLASAPESIQVSILEDIFDSLPLDNPYAVKFYDKYTNLKTAIKQIGYAKEAGFTPDKLRAILQANLAYIDMIEPDFVRILEPAIGRKKLDHLQEQVMNLPSQNIEQFAEPIIGLDTKIKESLEFAIKLDEPTTKASNTSKWKSQWLTKENGQKGLHKERRRNQKWLELADIYEKYRSELHRRGYYDYSDMLLEVIGQIEQHEDLRAEIQEQYNYVLIDEFQDSNTAQLRLAHLVADHYEANNKPNIMAVGDDDQSIFGFNGAELNNMLHFNRTYGQDVTTTIVLEDNYRSTPQVLAAAQQIIEQNSDRLVNRISGLSKNLVAKAKDLPRGEVIHRQYLTKDHQQYQIAHDIAKIYSNQPDATVAVIARKNKSLEQIALELNQLGVPIMFEHQQNILEHPSVTLIINIAKIVQAIIDGQADVVSEKLSLVLRHPMFDLPPELLWEIAKDNRSKNTWLKDILARLETKEIAQWLSWLASQASHQPLRVVLEHILGIAEDSPQTYFRDYFINHRKLTQDYLESLTAIKILRKMTREFSDETEPKLANFLDFIESEQGNNSIMSNSSALINYGQNIELLSVHKAKGLEFDIVFVIDAIASDWQPSSRDNSGSPANLPLSSPLESQDEYTRLMYVAATRAKYSLIFSSYRFDSTGKEVLPTPLILPIQLEEMPEPTIDEKISIAEQSLTWPRLKPASEKQILDDILDKFKVTATNLNAFLDLENCGPAKFIENNLLRLPSTKSIYMSHGTAMHAAMELAQKLTNLDKFNLDQVKQEYANSLIKEQLPRERLKLQIDHGQTMLDNIFGKLGYKLERGGLPEIKLDTTLPSGAKLTGKMDRIDISDDKSLKIIDYKTGSGLTNLFTKDKTKQIKAWKHRNQLAFYALLARQDRKYSEFHTATGQMVYLEVDDPAKMTLSFTPSQADIDRMERLVNVIWEMVINYQLPDTSQYSDDFDGIKQFEDFLIDNSNK